MRDRTKRTFSAEHFTYFLKTFITSAVIFAMLVACSEVGKSEPEQKLSGPAVVVDNAWAKATDGTMTGVFGDIKNTSDQPVTVESAFSPAADAQLHEVAQGVMKKVDDGFTVGPHSVFPLSPGANHIMLMKLKEPLIPGQDIHITLRLSSAEEIKFTAAVKEYTGANENYAPN